MKFTLQSVPISEIQGNNLARSQRSPEQFKLLCQSVKRYGILQPGIAYRDGDKIILVAGFGRKDAAHAAGLSEMPLQVYEGKINPVDLLILACQENNVRESMSFMDQVDALEKIVKHKGCTDQKAGELIGLKQSVTSKIMSAKARLADDVLLYISQNGYGYSFAYPLSKVPPVEQRNIAKRMVAEKWSRSQLEDELKPDAKRTLRFGSQVKISVSLPKDSSYDAVLEHLNEFIGQLKHHQKRDVPFDVVGRLMQ